VRSFIGFTLIELLITIIIMGILSVVIGKILFQSYQTFITAQYATEIDWQGWLALERMANDLHTIRSANDITTILSNQITFTDVNGNTVQYQLSGQSLMRNSQILASRVQSLNLSYQNQNGTTTAVPSAVRNISLSLTIAQGNLTASFGTLIATRGLS
jgi:prepilin-type N-terminal cleavage/methylation domain-containing protein